MRRETLARKGVFPLEVFPADELIHRRAGEPDLEADTYSETDWLFSSLKHSNNIKTDNDYNNDCHDDEETSNRNNKSNG